MNSLLTNCLWSSIPNVLLGLSVGEESCQQDCALYFWSLRVILCISPAPFVVHVYLARWRAFKWIWTCVKTMSNDFSPKVRPTNWPKTVWKTSVKYQTKKLPQGPPEKPEIAIIPVSIDGEKHLINNLVNHLAKRSEEHLPEYAIPCYIFSPFLAL